jgi:hypothetical protein
MASLILAKSLFKLAPPNIFKKATTNSNIIIGGVGKYVFENKLIINETLFYSIGLGIAQQNYLSGGVLLVGAFCSFFVPAYRLFKSWENKSIDIINCEYR